MSKTYTITKSMVLGGFILALQSEVPPTLHHRLSSLAWSKSSRILDGLTLWSYEILSPIDLATAKLALHEVGFTYKYKLQEDTQKEASKTYTINKSSGLGGFTIALQCEVDLTLHQRLAALVQGNKVILRTKGDQTLWSYEVFSPLLLSKVRHALHEAGFTKEEAQEFKLQDVLEDIAKEQEGCQVFAFPAQGKSCLASHLVHGNMGSFFASILRYTNEENREEMAKAFEDMHTDVLVSGAIVYFPSIAFEGHH
jgi:hypothetical protein